MASDVKRFAQRQPALFLGGAFTAGLMAARFLKSSAGESKRWSSDDMARSGTDGGRGGVGRAPSEYGASAATPGQGAE
jgi:hypothetical protein